jgi:L-threonylcarbamoyladenylate synthase
MSAPRVAAADRATPEATALDEAARVIGGGGIVAFATETLYGLAVDPWNAAAVARLLRAKGREVGKGMPLVVGDLESALAVASSIPPSAWPLAARHWPGALTLVLPAVGGLPRAVAPDGVAVRWTSSPLAAALARAAGGAITATSANRSGDPVPPLDAARVVSQLGAAIDLVLDSGPLPASLASTLVDARRDPPCLLRPGPVDPGPAIPDLA